MTNDKFGVVTMWGNDIKKMRGIASDLPDGEAKEKLLKILTKHKITRYNLKFINGDKVKEVLDEVLVLLSRCDMNMSIYTNIKSSIDDIKKLIDHGRNAV